LLKDAGTVDEAEKALKSIKAKQKEKFFFGVIKDAKPKAVQKTEKMAKLAQTQEMDKSTMMVEDLYLLYDDCRFISHHTRTVRAESERKEVFRMLKAMRDFIRSSGAYDENKLLKTPYGDHTLLVYGSGSLIVGLSTTGDAPPWTVTVISRVLGMIDEKYHDTLEGWEGDIKSLAGLGQYMKVLLLTFAKLESRMS
jgi:hypothetical protein